jgi:hypothetical protein
MNPSPCAASHNNYCIRTQEQCLTAALVIYNKQIDRGGLTEGCCLEGRDPVREVLVAGDDRLLGPVSVHGHVHHLAGDGHVLLVNPLLHVDHVPSVVGLRHGSERLVDGLELAAAILGHNHVRRERVLEPAALEHPPIIVGHPRRDAIHIELRPCSERHRFGNFLLLLGEQPAFRGLDG